MILICIIRHTTCILRMNVDCQTSDRSHGPNSHTRQPQIYRVPTVKEIIGFLVVIILENCRHKNVTFEDRTIGLLIAHF